MTTFNHQGIRVRRTDGRLLTDSHVSAYSRRLAVTNSVLAPVPDVPGLYVRLATREAARLTDRQREQIYTKARAWYEERYAPDDPALDTPEPLKEPDTAEGEPEQPAPEDVSDDPIWRTPEEFAADMALDNLTLDELRDMARHLDIPGRSAMNKAQLVAAIDAAKGE